MARLNGINAQYSTDDKRKEAVMDYWISYCPGISWGTLAGELHYQEEKESLQHVQTYLKKTKGMVIIIDYLLSS